jgi:hypothetical protein
MDLQIKNQDQIDIEHFKSGIYLLKISSSNHEIGTLKVVKQ